MSFENTNLGVVLVGLLLLTGCVDSDAPPAVKPNLGVAEELRNNLIATSGVAAVEEVQIDWDGKFATLKGNITIDGAVPTNPFLDVNKDLSVCKPGGGQVANEIVTVGADGKSLANVLVYADVPSEWCHESMINNTDTVEFDQKNCLFLNRIFPMQTTQTLKILNSDRVGHNASMKPSKNQEYNPNIAGGGNAVYPPGGGTLKQEKSPFPVSCAAHPWMQSYMIFRSNGYFAVTGDDGSFELPNLPAGVPVKVTVWHEATKGVPSSAVTADAVAEGWNKRGTFTVNLNADTPETVLNIAVNSSALSK